MKLIEFKTSYADPFYLLALIELCAIIDALVFLSSLGHVRTNLRTTLLFSEWIDNQKDKRLLDPFKKLKRIK
jgi:hypothetical protein